jgi:GT2 family glycosyltransferase
MQSSAVELSVVIPVYRATERLFRCLDAVHTALAHGFESTSEVVVASEDGAGGLVARLRERHPDVRVIEGGRRLGFVGNANRGVAAARGRIVCLLNDDMYVEPEYFSDCLKAFEAPELFAVCGRILEPRDGNGGLKCLELTARGSRVAFAHASDEASRAPAWVPYANGGGSFFRASTFAELGGFATDFAPYYWEDTDLGYRAWKRGYTIRYDPRFVLTHDHQATIGAERRRLVQRVRARNERQLVWRNLTDLSLAQILLRGDLTLAVRLLLKLRFRRLGWLLSDLRRLPAAARCRAAARPTQVRSDAELAELFRAAPHR